MRFNARAIDLPNEVFEKKEYFESLRIALEKLSSSENLIISLHVTEELTFEEISEITNKPMNTIKSQYRRAISKLKELLTDKKALHRYLHQTSPPSRI